MSLFVTLESVVSLHETIRLEAESFAESGNRTWSYLRRMMTMLNVNADFSASGKNRWITSEEREIILEELGPPPPYCYPLYIISVDDGRSERIAYIGKMSSRTPRFRNGHPAVTKLHAPEYEGRVKRVYLCSVVFRGVDFTYATIEQIQSVNYADAILASLESQLIYYFKPPLNSSSSVTENSKWKWSISLANNTGQTNFLSGAICHHPDLPLLV
ncbi:hypothetical protein [Achromobacter dolens]|uniref:hypothetical protein n=1 Tax=Achromobacter dolens TaxID=1287738 RepID=UPI00300D5468